MASEVEFEETVNIEELDTSMERVDMAKIYFGITTKTEASSATSYIH